jgi:hypothetical protein
MMLYTSEHWAFLTDKKERRSQLRYIHPRNSCMRPTTGGTIKTEGVFRIFAAGRREVYLRV